MKYFAIYFIVAYFGISSVQSDLLSGLGLGDLNGCDVLKTIKGLSPVDLGSLAKVLCPLPLCVVHSGNTIVTSAGLDALRAQFCNNDKTCVASTICKIVNGTGPDVKKELLDLVNTVCHVSKEAVKAA